MFTIGIIVWVEVVKGGDRSGNCSKSIGGQVSDACRSIEFQIYYKEDYNSRPITYELAIDLDTDNRPYVKKERLRHMSNENHYL